LSAFVGIALLPFPLELLQLGNENFVVTSRSASTRSCEY
jgi:hypothetical protein